MFLSVLPNTLLAQCNTGTNGYLHFDGRNNGLQYAQASTAALDTLGDFTVEMWFRIDGPTGLTTQTLLATQPDGTPARPLFIGLINGAVEIDLNWQPVVGATHLAATPPSPATTYDDGAWHHAAIVRSGGDIAIVMDGSEVAGLVVDGTSPTAQFPLYSGTFPLRFGSHVTNYPFAPTWTTYGGLDEVRMWSVARSVADIQAHMHSVLSGDEAGLFAYWRFDEAAGQVLYDWRSSAAQPLHGTLGPTNGIEAVDAVRADSDGPPIAYCPLGRLKNPSFEAPCSSSANLFNGSDAIPAWSVSGEVDWICTLWSADDQHMSLDLNGCAAGGVSQTFATVAGERYLVTFSMSGNPGLPGDVQGPAIKTLQVSAAGATSNFAFDTTGRSVANMGWRQENWTFTAVAAATTIAFQSTNGGCQGPVLDRVVVTRIAASACSAGVTLTAGGEARIGRTLSIGLANHQGWPLTLLGFGPRMPVGCTCELIADGAGGLGLLLDANAPGGAAIPIPANPNLIGVGIELQGVDFSPPSGGCSFLGIDYSATGIWQFVIG